MVEEVKYYKELEHLEEDHIQKLENDIEKELETVKKSNEEIKSILQDFDKKV